MIVCATDVRAEASAAESRDRCLSLFNDRVAAVVAHDWQSLESFARRYIRTCAHAYGDEDISLAWNDIALAKVEKGEHKGALEAAKSCIVVFYRNAECHLSRARALIRLGRRRDALEALDTTDRLVDHVLQAAVEALAEDLAPPYKEVLESNISQLKSIGEFSAALRSDLRESLTPSPAPSSRPPRQAQPGSARETAGDRR
jgi:tetratricopeptide (TPR) repeat protein